MKFLSANNVFESIKFARIANKFSGFLTFSIQKKVTGKYFVNTTALDIGIFVILFTFFCGTIFSVLNIPLKMTTNSVIIELGMFVNSKVVVMQPLIVILLNFYNRKTFFKVFENLHWIDKRFVLKI
jgi:hypothetical protein